MDYSPKTGQKSKRTDFEVKLIFCPFFLFLGLFLGLLQFTAISLYKKSLLKWKLNVPKVEAKSALSTLYVQC